jgi:hypothetical protein
MKLHTVFCSACDRDVALLARETDLPDALARGDVACLENGSRCTGTACPYCASRPTAAEAAPRALPAAP